MKLAEFVEHDKQQAIKKPTRCQTCNLPKELLDQVHAARATKPRVPFPVISRWLKNEEGISILQATIRNHFVADHHHDQS
jgi:hypothetical protein